MFEWIYTARSRFGRVYWYDGCMKSERKMRIQRFAWYFLVLIIFPLITSIGWVLYQLFFVDVFSLWVLISGSLVLAFVVIYVLSGQVAARIPSLHDQDMATLVRAQERFVLLYERSPVPYVTLDNEGKIIMHNLAAVRLFETTTDMLHGISLKDIIFHQDQSVMQKITLALRNKQTFTDREVQVMTANNSSRWVLISAFGYSEAQQMLVTMVDITHRKEVDTAKSEFVALATHQLRTPVAAIRWNLELLQSQLPSDVSARATKYLDKIQRNTLRMIALINDFLNVSKLEMGTFATDLKPINVAQFCNSVLDEFTQAIEQKQLVITPSYQPSDLVMVSDERLLHIIISNLVSNAVKYIPAGGSIGLSYIKTGIEVEIIVKDTGIGIPEGELPELFSKFFRASNAQIQQAEGTGLGLYVVKQSVEKLGGFIEVSSVENQGTTFTVRLPYRSS